MLRMSPTNAHLWLGRLLVYSEVCVPSADLSTHAILPMTRITPLWMGLRRAVAI